MSRLRTVVREIYGLFVDDGAFALSLAAWVVIFWLLRTHLASARLLAGPAFAAGLALLLAASVWRFARRGRP